MDDHNEERMEEAYDETELLPIIRFEELSFDNLLDQVESNDPSLRSVKISTRILFPNDDDHQHRLVERLSTAIGGNTHVKALMLDAENQYICEAHAMILFQILFRGIACNQSIKRFLFCSCGDYLGNVCHILTPLFKNNQVERVWFDDCELSINSIRLLATSLAMFDSLKEFGLICSDLQDNTESEQVSRDLVQALSGHSGLRDLDLKSTEVGKHGCSALVDLLSNPNINLRVLDLTDNNLGDDEAVALASGMAGTTLKEIIFPNNKGITEVGWQAIFHALSSSSCRLEMINLDDNDINDAAAQSLSNALASNTTLKTLDLGYNNSITIAGWRVLFDFLQSSNCDLEDLGLRGNDFNDEAMTSLIDALANTRSLRSLDPGAGWQRFLWQIFFSTVFTNPSSGLTQLDLRGCRRINDATIRALTNALVNNSKLKVLCLAGNDLITNAEVGKCSLLF